MSVSTNSIEAFYDLDSFTLITLKQQVYEVIRNAIHPSNRDIARMLDKPINTITPRTNELVNDGLIIKGGDKIDPFSKKRVSYWVVACP